LNGLFACGVNVEDIGEPKILKSSKKPRSVVTRGICIPFALGFFSEFECKLAFSRAANAMQNEDALTCVI